MANRYRGDVEAIIAGERRVMRLTLGALAELETAFGAEDMADLARRLGSGTLKARDAVRIVAAGLRGAGEPVTDAEVAALPIDGGAPAWAALVVRLIAETFGGASETGEGVDAAPLDRPVSRSPSPGTT
ncbi:gene transfer agent family protein [Chthonobacter albigriseus]|uniref:gene transfer agent family protein n=1 Tax=Chthonobacter albigriseus TaxID=1683161 RepID=UPI0015EE6F17|nr:gene transfer agent family protein [Chthonobacter albigriseus]